MFVSVVGFAVAVAGSCSFDACCHHGQWLIVAVFRFTLLDLQFLLPSILRIAIFIVAVAVAFTMVDCCNFSIVVSIIFYSGCSHLVQCRGLLRHLLIPLPSPTVDCCHFYSCNRCSCGCCSCLLAFSCDAMLLLLAFTLAIAGWLIVVIFYSWKRHALWLLSLSPRQSPAMPWISCLLLLLSLLMVDCHYFSCL